jgi:PTS system N-acetylglucosamine-specific IIC component
MYRAARPERRKAVGGMLFSLALTSALTGVTEPIEFSFMFLAPALFAVHAVLTGIAMVVMDLLGVKLGFGFSAGLFDYVLNFGKASKPLLLIPVGLVYFALYYGIFSFVIRRFNLQTPGREPEAAAPSASIATTGVRGADFAAALGGSSNITSVDACTTRLRLMVKDQARVDEATLKALGARGIIRPSAHALQVVLGPIADSVAVEIRDALASGGVVIAAAPVTTESSEQARLNPAALAALGGAENVLSVRLLGTRLRVELCEPAPAGEAALVALGVRSVAHPSEGVVHLLLAPGGAKELLAA